MAQNIPELYGSLVFNDKVMRSKLPKDMYKALKKTIENGTHLELDVANSVAVAMKEWATENGATHYTHWFQPMTNVTAEKHDSFISPTGDGQVIMDFSGKELVKGEPDASSFPSGGLRATFEARGYTAWDPTSPAFIKDGTLYIPTAFCSYSGEALDKKTPLLRSMETLDKEATNLLHIMGNKEVRHVNTTVGPEQEYFLVDKELYKQRKDLVFCGRTLIGAPAPKGQEMEDHYFGALKPRVAAYMHDLDVELWKLGIPAKTKHNEVAPAQHELAPVFDTTNVAVDHNQLTMEVMKKVADKHDLVCLLHEKPFEGINGSGKHNNWSMITDTGVNILDPGKTPAENTQFLIFLTAVIKAVDEYADVLRISVASAGNDHRLGANEAPPAVVSVFLGDELTEILKSIENGEYFAGSRAVQMDIGAKVLPHFVKDNTDRNRTSPFAFTGNKFEFRMLGSEASVANPNIILNTAVAECVHQFAEQLKDVPDDKMDDAIHELIRKTITDHKRVIFNGNGYTDEWIEEAEKRGLYNLKSTPDALPQWIADKNIELFTKYHIFTKEEIESRYEIWLETYSKILNIESNTMVEMVQKDFLPSVFAYIDKIAATAVAKKSVVADVSTASEGKLIKELSQLADEISTGLDTLKADTAKALATEDPLANAKAYQTVVLSDMETLRKSVDAAEVLIPDALLPYPTYDKLLFSV
ncbi:glutamine synthetase type III [Ruminococcus sp. AF37-6AT]|jgi:glutamine synthetase|nr:glutamine synthetase III [uncultured Blautia sp.]MBS6712975.1 glutamine synthetase III [Ruminococcus sp.]RHG53211.1 glutamine synthetase type III [Ruminococcus sp. AM22-13]RHJ91293.1 glutamine synthetase type III [Ruminococcus sp. AM07-21]RHL42679.1 glutamine synthetase type III [Ruminococcus sp. AF37-6AT]RHO84405.1 glutamine synthetase type III [Ruminococcus sp. AF42-9BH]RHP57568.1 glutamine synthetase type III [Ruminococcus sp. AF31-16BH]RHQ45259.1 glutamine synthetase type III [Ruminoc